MIELLAIFATGMFAGVVFATLIRRTNKTYKVEIPLSLKTQLEDTLSLLEGEKIITVSITELLERVDLIARNLQGRYDVLMNNLAAAVVVYDENWKIRFVSPYTEILTGYSAHEFYSADEDLFEIIAVGEESDKYARAKKITQLGEDFHLQYQVRHKSGVTLWLDSRVVPIYDEDDKVIGLLAVTIDVTESIRQRRQLEEQNQDLKDFSYMVSHDLKAPIFTIKGMVAALREDYGERLDQEAHQLLEYIVDGATRLEKLVSSVIEYSAITIRDGKSEPVLLRDVFNSVMKDLSEQVRLSGGAVRLPNTNIALLADPVRVYQVFSNLIGNAIKYRSPERTLDVSVSVEIFNDLFAKVDVRDNGLGVPSNKLSDIFRPYHRAHSSDIEGSGIGLASVKKIVEKAGGSVSVRSDEGKGSVFSVLLPIGEREKRVEPQQIAQSA